MTPSPRRWANSRVLPGPSRSSRCSPSLAPAPRPSHIDAGEAPRPLPGLHRAALPGCSQPPDQRQDRCGIQGSRAQGWGERVALAWSLGILELPQRRWCDTHLAHSPSSSSSTGGPHPPSPLPPGSPPGCPVGTGSTCANRLLTCALTWRPFPGRQGPPLPSVLTLSATQLSPPSVSEPCRPGQAPPTLSHAPDREPPGPPLAPHGGPSESVDLSP